MYETKIRLLTHKLMVKHFICTISEKHIIMLPIWVTISINFISVNANDKMIISVVSPNSVLMFTNMNPWDHNLSYYKVNTPLLTAFYTTVLLSLCFFFFFKLTKYCMHHYEK